MKYKIPIVICGVCFHSMDIKEWLAGFDTEVGNYVPHPNRSHLCKCGMLWEPSSGIPGDRMSEACGIMFFCDMPDGCVLEK